MSSREKGPIRPPLAFDAESDTSPATLPKSSPAISAGANRSAFFFAASSAATLNADCPCLLAAGTSI